MPMSYFLRQGMKSRLQFVDSKADIPSRKRVGNPVEQFRRLCGEDVTKQLKQIGGLDEEGEINAAWRDVGVHGLWYMFGA